MKINDLAKALARTAHISICRKRGRPGGVLCSCAAARARRAALLRVSRRECELLVHDDVRRHAWLIPHEHGGRRVEHARERERVARSRGDL